jgi:ClpX C4-type zinc finger
MPSRDEEAYLQADDEKPQLVEPFEPTSIVCQFCGKSWQQVRGVFQAKRRVRDPNTSAIAAVWICNECVARMAQTLAEEPQGTPWLLGWQVWSQGGPTRA